MGKPKIRFKGYTEDWEQRKLGDSCKINGRIGFRGYTEKDIISKEAGGVLTFSPTNIVDNKLTIECKNTYITRKKYDESPEIKISNGDILFVKTGSTLGKSALVTGLKEDASINPQIVVMRVEKDTENFMSNVLITDRVMKQVAAVKIGGAVPTMTETELKNFTYFAPAEKEEKKKIGDYFRTLDHLITLHQRKCDETKKLKKCMLQKMFPKEGEKVPEIRFSGFTGDWKQRKVSEIALQTYGGGTPRTSNEEFWKGNIPWIQSSDLTVGCLFNIKPRKYISQKAVSKSATKLVPQNSIAIVTRVGVGKLIFMPFSYSTSQDFLSLSELKTEPEFTVYALYKMMQLVSNEVQGTSIKGITKDELLAKKLLIPGCDEQKKIGMYLHSLDNLITLHKKKCDELRNIKEFMLQNMFI